MRHPPVITMEAFESAREKSDDIWTDYDVFDEERDAVDSRELVLEVVEGQFTHPSGDHSLYEVDESVDSLIWDKVFHDGLVPADLPADVKEEFARKLTSKVKPHAENLYKDVREEADDAESISDLQALLEARAGALGIPQKF